MMKKRTLKTILLWVAIIYVVILIGIYSLQNYVIFQPKDLDKNHVYKFKNPFEEYFLKTTDNVELNVLLFKTEMTRKGLVLYFHGNAGNLSRWGKIHEDFVSRGYDIAILDFRGYGKSTGNPSEEPFYEDAKLFYDWALEKYPDDKFIIFGRSLGCAVASNLAMKVDIEKVILETPFFNISDAIRGHITRVLLPFDLRNDFPNNQHIQKIKEPIFIFAGTKDRVVLNSSTEKLKPFLKTNDRYIVIEGKGHNDLNSSPKYNQELDLILK